jgi:membrane protein YqaA with SNARE-associated domain
MPALSTVALFLLAALGLLIIPGPSVLYIITRSVAQQILLLGALFVLLASCTDSLYSLLGSTMSRWLTRNAQFKQNSWFGPGNEVNRWDVTSLYVTGEACFFEWVFECTFARNRDGFEGASIAQFRNEKIVFLREYAMTAKRYEWEG